MLDPDISPEEQGNEMSAQPIVEQMPADLTDRIKAAIEAADQSSAACHRGILRGRLARASRSGLARRLER